MLHNGFVNNSSLYGISCLTKLYIEIFKFSQVQ